MKKKLVAFCLLSFLSITAVSCGSSSSLLSSKASSAASSSVGVSSAPSSQAPSSEAPSSAVSSSSSAGPVSSSTPVSSSSSSSSSIEDVIPPDPTYPTALPEGSQVREFNPLFDTMIDDFSASSPKGTLAGGAVYNAAPYLKVRLNSSNDVFPSSADASIYKQGEGTYPIKDYDGIGFKIKLHDAKTIANNQLVLALRGDDSCKVYEIPLDKAINPDGENLPALDQEYQEFIVSPNQTISDENTVYTKNDGTASDIKVLQNIVGFHLYAKGKADCTIDIQSVYLVKGTAKTILDDFEHDKPNEGGANLWWRDSTGVIVKRGVTVSNGGSYSLTTDKTAGNIVLDVHGNTGSAKVVFAAEGKSKEVAWADLKDANKQAVPAALKEVGSRLVINLVESGVDFVPTSYKLVSDSETVLEKVFLTDLITKSAEPYASIDAAKDDITVFDSFNRTQTGFNGDYDASHSSQTIIDAGLDYALSYNAETASMVSVDGSALVFDGTALPEAGYIQLKEGSDAHMRTNQKYMVFSMKMTDGATLDNFRFGYGGAGIKYFNDCFAGFMKKSVDTPYVGSDYSWYVIDIEETGIKEVSNMLDMYYSGKGKLFIDEIFFADDYKNAFELKSGDVNAEWHDKAIDLTQEYTYVYGTSIDISVNPIVALTLKGDGTDADLSTMRLELNGATKWAKDGVLIAPSGISVSTAEVLPSETVTIYIDLVKSGFALEGDNNLHFHFGAAGKKGTITLSKLDVYGYKYTTYSRISAEASFDVSTYKYVGFAGNYNDLNSSGKKYLKLVVKGDGTATLASFRLADGKGEFWVRDSKIVLADGTLVDPEHVVSAEGETYLIDLDATGINIASGAECHAHMGGLGTGTLKIESMDLILTVAPYLTIMANH